MDVRFSLSDCISAFAVFFVNSAIFGHTVKFLLIDYTYIQFNLLNTYILFWCGDFLVLFFWILRFFRFVSIETTDHTISRSNIRDYGKWSVDMRISSDQSFIF